MNQTKRTILAGVMLVTIIISIVISQNSPKSNKVKAEEKVKTHVMKKVENEILAFKTRDLKKISNNNKEN